MKKTFRNLMVMAACFALMGFVTACSSGSKSGNDSTAVEEEATEEVQQTPFQAAAEIVKDLPEDYSEMTEAQTTEFKDKAKALCDATNGQPAEVEVATGLDMQLSNVRYEDWRPGDNSIKVAIMADFSKSAADYRVLCLDNENKIVFNNMLSSSTDTNHMLVSGWVAPDNAEKWASVVKFVLVSNEVGDPLKRGEVYNP